MLDLPTPKTYGHLSLDRATKRWILSSAPPHVALRLKGMFPRLNKAEAGTFTFRHDAPTCVDLSWFLHRFPMAMDAEDRRILVGAVAMDAMARQSADRLFATGWKPSAVPSAFKDGMAPYDFQTQAADLAVMMGRLLIMDDVGLGKEQPLTAKILTPTGWKTMGEAYVGMPIIGADGRAYEVTGVYPQGCKPAYRVSFSDGATTECGAEHLWKTRDQNRRLRGKGWAVKPLAALMRQGIRTKQDAPKWEIPLASPIDHPSPSLIIPPYVLGVLIGDGYLTGSSVSFSVPPSKEAILARVAELVGQDRVNGPSGSPAAPQFHILGKTTAKNEYRRALADLGLIVGSLQRFVPAPYFACSAADRLELLRGLMDTDGSCQRNRTTFHTCSPQLAIDVAALVRSLGATATIREYDRTEEGKSIEWQVSIRISDCPFHLAYKAEGWRSVSNFDRPRRYIRDVEYVGDVEQQCISVSAPDSLYVTDDYIVTHNTVSALAAIIKAGFGPAAIVVQSHLQGQWLREYVMRFTTLAGCMIKTKAPYDLPPADLYIFKYSQTAGWVDVAATGAFPIVVWDEIQELRSGEDAQKGQAAKIMAANARLRIGLSATPIYNLGDEMWNIMEYIEPGCLGTREEFLREWCSGRVVKDPDALGAYLREQHLVIRRERGGCRVNTLIVDVPSDESAVDKHQDLARRLAIQTLNGSFVERGKAARELDLLLRQLTGISKAKHVAAYVRMLIKAGRPVILAGWHREFWAIIQRELADLHPVMYTGTETQKQKDQSKDDFISGKTDLFNLSLRSGAGVDGLQHRCPVVCIGELDWSPKVHEQIIGRVDRPPYPQDTVDAIFFTTDWGSDPLIVELLGLKASQSHGIVNPGQALQPVRSDESRLRLLAERYLAQIGAPPTQEIQVETALPPIAA